MGENMVHLLGAKGDGAEKMLKDYTSQKAKYEELSKKIQDEAKTADDAAEAAEHRALRYDVGEGMLEIGLVLSSLYFISRKGMFPVLELLRELPAGHRGHRLPDVGQCGPKVVPATVVGYICDASCFKTCVFAKARPRGRDDLRRNPPHWCAAATAQIAIQK